MPQFDCWFVTNNNELYTKMIAADENDNNEQTVNELIRKWKLEDVEQRKRFYYRAAQQIQTMHNEGIVHGDIKPENFVYGKLPESSSEDWYLIDLDVASPAGTYWDSKRGTAGYYVQYGCSNFRGDLL